MGNSEATKEDIYLHNKYGTKQKCRIYRKWWYMINLQKFIILDPPMVITPNITIFIY